MLDDIKTYLKNANLIDRLMIILLVVFVMTVWLNGSQLGWVLLSSDASDLLTRPWTLMTYALVHRDVISLIANAIMLYYFGHLFLDYFTLKQLLLYLVLGVLIGALSYELFYLFSADRTVYLSGFDVAIATMIAGFVAKLPYYNLYLRFIGSVKIWVIFALWLVLNSISAIGINLGEVVALVTASVLGYLLTVVLKEGQRLIDVVYRQNSPSHLKTIYKSNASNDYQKSYRSRQNTQEEIDRILDKISASGYDNLTPEEKAFLFNQKR